MKTLVTALALLAMGVGSSAGQTVEKSKITMATAAATAGYVAPYVAKSLGYFADEGLNVQVVNFQGGSKALQALMGGSVDIAIGSYAHAINLTARGQHVEAIANFLRCPAFVVAASTSTDAKTLADLKGMKLGITSPGSSTHQALNYLLSRAGVKPDEYTPVGIGNTSGAVAAVENNRVDGLLLVDPIISILQDKKAIRIIVDGRTDEASRKAFGGPFPEGSILAQTSFVKENPKTSQAIANAIVKADHWLQTASADDVVKNVPKELVGADAELFKKSFEKGRGCLSPDGIIPDDGAQTVLKILSTSDPKVAGAGVDLSKTYTNMLVEKAASKD